MRATCFSFSKNYKKGFTPTSTFTKSFSEFMLFVFGNKTHSVNLYTRKLVRGFTLIELMVTIGIMGILTAILFSSYPDSIVRIGLSNTNHKIALLIREAQVRGSSVDSRTGLNVVSGYGVFASSTATTSLILFSDFVGATQLNGIFLGDGLYNKTPVDEKISTLNLLQNFKISNLCVKTGGVQSCIANGLNNLTVSFTRPNPRPHIYINNIKTTDYDEACIEISSPKAPLFGHVRAIKVYNTGFIETLIKSCTAL